MEKRLIGRGVLAGALGAPCARAIRDRFWATPRSGTAPPTIAAASCAGHARCSLEFGLYLPEDVAIRVEDSNQKHRFMVMPVRPEGTQDWAEDQLAEILTRDCLIGVAVPKVGVTTNAITDTRPAIHPVQH